MSLYAGLFLALLGVVCIAAGVQNRGVQLAQTVMGGGAASGKVGGTGKPALFGGATSGAVSYA